MLKDIKDTMLIVNEQTGYLGRETETIKKNQLQTLELKNTTSEIKKKMLDGYNSRLGKTKEKSVNVKID